MKTKELGNEAKEINIAIPKDVTDTNNQFYISDLIKIKGVMTSVPSFVPRKFIDQIQIVLTGGVYYLYIYCADTTPGTWKSVVIA